MNISELSDILKGYFGWHKARTDCMARMLIALIQNRTVNLARLAVTFASGAKLDSRYKRIQRFFSQWTIDISVVAPWVLGLFGLSDQPVYLALDRTNWRWGKKDINILMLSVVYKGIALPVLWRLLPHRGNSSTALRIELIQQFIDQVGADRIAGILADREFIGRDWIAWLQKARIPFCIRLKNNLITTNARGLAIDIEALFYGLKPGEQRILNTPRRLGNLSVYLAGARSPTGALIIVATDRYRSDPIGLYCRRWEIETLFGCLKSKGFCFEQTHLTQPERISQLLVLLTFAFCWAHKTGEWLHAHKPISLASHGRLRVSLFRYGLDYLQQAFYNTFQHFENWATSLFALLHFPPWVSNSSLVF
jgi:hypothetical protein